MTDIKSTLDQIKAEYMDHDLFTESDASTTTESTGNKSAVKYAREALKYDSEWDESEITEFMERFDDGTLSRNDFRQWDRQWLEQNKTYISAKTLQYDYSTDERTTLIRNAVDLASGKAEDEGLVTELAVALQDGEYDVRWAAAQGLGELRDESGVRYGIPTLVDAVERRDPSSRSAILSLSSNGDGLRRYPQLARRLETSMMNLAERPFYQCLLAEALVSGKHNTTAVAAMLGRLTDPATYEGTEDADAAKHMIAKANQALRQMGDSASPAFAGLRANLYRGNESERYDTARTLAQCGPEGALVLVRELKSGDAPSIVRTVSVKALGTVVHHYTGLEPDDSDYQRRFQVSIDIFNALSTACNDHDPRVAIPAAEAVAEWEVEDGNTVDWAADRLTAIFDDGTNTLYNRRDALVALGNLYGPGSDSSKIVDTLTRGLNEHNPDLVLGAIKGLSSVYNPKSVRVLQLTAMNTDNPDFALASIKSLADISQNPENQATREAVRSARIALLTQIQNETLTCLQSLEDSERSALLAQINDSVREFRG